MIVHFRIDDRLIHGQVTVSWTKHVGTQRILVVNDEVVNDEIQRALLPLAAPPGVEVLFSNLNDANNYVDDGKNTFILVKTPEDALNLVDSMGVKEINIGNIGYIEGRRKIKKSLSLNDDDISCLRSIADKGINVYFQMLPQDKKIPLSDLLR